MVSLPQISDTRKWFAPIRREIEAWRWKRQILFRIKHWWIL